MSQSTLRLRVIIWLLLIDAAVAARMPDGCKSRNLSVTADDSMRLFIDGREITDLSDASSWLYPDTLDLPCTTRVVAIEANNTFQVGAILASTDDGYIKTNSSWKCKNTRIQGWQEVDFNDSSWKQAVAVPYHDPFPETTSTIIREDARWIWTKDYSDGDLNVFCRKKLDVDECLFGQPINECDPSMGRCISFPRGYNCSCYSGYQKDGQHKCKDVDECLLGPLGNKCNDSSGSCINTPGSYKCRCYQGFTNVEDQRCEVSSNSSTLLLILGVSLGVCFLIIVALIVSLSILCSRTSTSKDQGRNVNNTGANRSDINALRFGNISSNKSSSPEGTYAHLDMTTLRDNQNDNYEQIIE